MTALPAPISFPDPAPHPPTRSQRHATTRVEPEAELYDQFRQRHGFDPDPLPADGKVALAHLVWAPFVFADEAALRAELGPLAEAVAEFAEASLAERTHATYRSAWRQVVFWCLATGNHPHELTPVLFAGFCLWAACATEDDQLLLGPNGEYLRGTVSPSTLDVFVTAVDRVRQAADQEPLRPTAAVKSILKGIRNRFGNAPTNRKAAIDIDLLITFIDVIRNTNDDLRDRAVMAVWAAGLTPTAIAGLDWTDLTPQDGTEHITTGHTLLVIEDPRAIDAIAKWRARTGHGPFAAGGFTTSNDQRTPDTRPASPATPPPVPDVLNPGQFWLEPAPEPEPTAHLAMTRPGIVQLIRRVLTAHGLPVAAGTRCPDPHDYRSHDLTRLWSKCTPTKPLTAARDESILTTAFFTAHRRVNLVDARWDQFDFQEDTIIWTPGPTKTNPTADPSVGPTTWILERSPDPDRIPCPVASLERLREQVTALVGADPVTHLPNAPVFFPINRHDQPEVIDPNGNRRSLTPTLSGTVELAPLSGDAVCNLIQRLAARAGLDPTRFGAHSTRAGFTTSMFALGFSAAEIAQITGHKSYDVLMSYNRPDYTRTPSPSRQLMARLTDNESGSI